MHNILALFSQPDDLALEEIIIVGAGKFGVKAYEKLSKKYSQARITIVDNNAGALQKIQVSRNITFVEDDALGFLTKNLEIFSNAWLVPAIPLHVACECIVRRLKYKSYKVTPEALPPEFKSKLPNVFIQEGRDDLVFTSFANFICPDNCPEPSEKCTYTGEPRKGNLYEVIANLLASFSLSGVVIRSFQLSPGIGGYPLRNIIEAISFVEGLDKAIVATACKCHGVINAFCIKK